jgi:hypothetical protein
MRAGWLIAKAGVLTKPSAGAKRSEPQIPDLHLRQSSEGQKRPSKYASAHTRICRPVWLSADDVWVAIDFVVDRIGLTYDLENIIDLLRYLLPTPPVPTLLRRMIALGAGPAYRAICSTLRSHNPSDQLSDPAAYRGDRDCLCAGVQDRRPASPTFTTASPSPKSALQTQAPTRAMEDGLIVLRNGLTRRSFLMCALTGPASCSRKAASWILTKATHGDETECLTSRQPAT